MALRTRVNPFSKTNPDSGFGTQGKDPGTRFINKDGSFNIVKDGIPFFKTLSIYSWALELSGFKFFLIIIALFLSENILFTCLYLLPGDGQLEGMMTASPWQKLQEVFFFSTETLTTVGYGRVNPIGTYANVIAAIESMMGWLTFAVLTGLVYGKLTRPSAYIAFSNNALVSPYKEGKAIMFRLVPYKKYHYLTDARLIVNLVMKDLDKDTPSYNFYELKLERSRIDFLTMNWTVVHPIDDESPLLNFGPEDLEALDLELYVQVSGFDPVFSNQVTARTSYTYKELVWGAKFDIMYEDTPEGPTIVDVGKLNQFKRVEVV